MRSFISKLKLWLDALLIWLREVIPWSLNIGIIVYNYLASRLMAEKLARQKAELEKIYLENRRNVEYANKNKSSADIVSDAIDEGRKQ